MITTQQEYINMLYTLQCCYADKAEKLYQKEYLGSCTKSTELKLREMYMYLMVLVGQNIEEDNNCLTNAQINCILERMKILCNECCIDMLEEE